MIYKTIPILALLLGLLISSHQPDEDPVVVDVACSYNCTRLSNIDLKTACDPNSGADLASCMRQCLPIKFRAGMCNPEIQPNPSTPME